MDHAYIEEGFPFSSRKKALLKDFLETADLDYDENIEYSVMLRDEKGSILATGSRHKNILKCLAVSEKHQGMGYLNTVMTQLMKQAYTEGLSHLFVFTKPMYTDQFTDLGFHSIICTDTVQFMENTANGIQSYLKAEQQTFPAPSADSKIGAIVMNANPFTNGHRYLIQQAAGECDFLHVFVLSAKESQFAPDVRLRLVKEGCRDLSNVYVHGSSEYLISYATFPDYFMKDKVLAQNANGELDLLIFCKYFKEAFGITHRFVGEEPLCPVTRAYNRQMQEILPKHGIQVHVIPRICAGDTIISATTVRRLLLEKRWDELMPLVPQTTYDYLRSHYL